MYRSEYIVCFRSEISFVPLLFSHRTPFLRPYWQIYFNSTSNHNFTGLRVSDYGVVSYFNSTSNHNLFTSVSRRVSLFLISILHQTTTHEFATLQDAGCFLFQFYIKPQRSIYTSVPFHVVSYFNSTSNHNLRQLELDDAVGCFLFQFYIKPQLTITDDKDTIGCFLFQFYIKPQLIAVGNLPAIGLFLISILHQTTTSDMRFVDCHSVMWPNERYERRMTGRGSRNDAGFVFQRYFSLKVECTSCARNRYMFAK